MPTRMLRHKALKEAARYAFGFAGIVDEDEARDIDRSVSRLERPIPAPTGTIVESSTTSPPSPDLEVASPPLQTADPETGEVFNTGFLLDKIDPCDRSTG